MKRFGKLAVFAGLVLLGMGVLQARHGHGADHHDSGALHAVAHVSTGVMDKIVDFIDWATDKFWHNQDSGSSHMAANAQSDEFEWSGRIEAGDAIEIKGVNGDVVAVATGGNEVEVTAAKTARKSDPSEVRIEVVEHSGGVTICAVYPGRGNTCEPGDAGKTRVQNNDVQVRFYVSVPEGVTFVGKTVNGDVQVDDLDSDVEATTVNGGLQVSTTGSVEATTVNGSIRASMDSYDWDGVLEFSTVNGSITLDVPDDLDADLEASWVNGGLDTDLPFTAEGRMSKRHAEGVLGAGGPEIELNTVNGSIRIR